MKVEKIKYSLKCPLCGSNEYTDHHHELTDSFEGEWKDSSFGSPKVEVTTTKKYIECHCNICNHDYTINLGYDIHTKFLEPVYLTCSTNQSNAVIVKSAFKSDTERNYKIVCIGSVDMILYEDDPYPVIIPKEETEEYIQDPKRVRTLTYHTFMDRYR